MPLYPPQIQTVMDPWGTHECRLDWVSTTTIRFYRVGGQWLMINGKRYSIPSAGVDLNVSALNGTYLIYAYISGGVMGLSAYQGSYANDNFGMPCAGGNPDATIVGLIYVASGVMAHQGYVCSYWNRKQRMVSTGVVTQGSGSASMIEISAALRCVFTSFSGEAFEAFASGSGYNQDVLGLIVYMQFVLDGVALGDLTLIQPHYAGWYCPFGQRLAANAPAADGARTLQVYGQINAAGYNATWQLYTGVRWLG